MKAVVLRSEDGPDALTIEDRPEPTAGPDEVLIDVQAAGVSFVDVLMSRGKYQERPALPFVPGVEVAGIVRTAPSGSALSAGDRVAAYMLHGGYAEVAVAPASTTFALPDQLDFRAGTALALNYQTSHFALVRRGHLEAGQTVLVHGGAGGVGVAGVQLAKAHGATVIASVRSADKADAATAAGADHVVVTEEGWAKQVREYAPRGVQLVLDPVGGPVFDDTIRLLAPEGRYLVVGFAGSGIPSLALNRVLLRNIDVVGVGWGAFLGTDSSIVGAAADDFAQLAAAGSIDPPIGTVYPLADAATALRDLEGHAATGKLVLDLTAGALTRLERPLWFRIALADEPETVETLVAGTVVRARCWGPPGPGVILVHGGAAHASWWDHIGPLLSAEHRIVAVDLSGHGASGRRPEYTLAAWAEEVAALAVAGGITGAPMVVGHSMGGYVALTLAGGRPDAVNGVVVIDSAVPGVNPDPDRIREPTAASTLRRYPTKDAALQRFRVTPPDPYVLPYVAAYVAAESVGEVDGGWTWKFDPVSQRRDHTLPPTLLSNVVGRLAIVRAEHGFLTRAIAEQMLAWYGRPAPVIELPGTGHHVLLDDPIALVVALRALIATWDSIPV